MKRDRNYAAYSIWYHGASNPSGVALALVDAIKECREEGQRPEDDIPCQMIVDHLAFLLGLPQPSLLCGSGYEFGVFCADYEQSLNRTE